MPKSPADRKAAQRARQRDAGVVKIEIHVDAQELEMLKRNCVLRRPGRDPYDIDEYLTTLIRQDDAALQQQIAELNKRNCKKCGDKLPVAECCLSGASECWNTLGWHDLKLIM
ncbi:hypothetical protein [Candidatus Symbiopectobacterium sp. NZEC135]|uniref:hypothetical protein n=1 Tax=Candidatus Symbiopectobacterium sp. NZEC135 TaxID=2820471 RepID=UPI00222714BA|nr:hypothetical protein [Candidatus Symbiopectobacterium sp. NZEC135]MCW2479164.1 hypothetical protein [Candidatus Symbiopectobacterium sp. NZEC135]